MGLQQFDLVVAEHGARVLRVCRALTSPADADDVWSETFLAALQAYPGLPDGSNLVGWLATIAHHKAIDHHRKARRQAVPAETLPEPPSHTAASVEARLDLWAAIAELPNIQRQAVAHHYLGGLPYREVAGLIGNSEAAARRAGADGVRALRSRLQEGDTS